MRNKNLSILKIFPLLLAIPLLYSASLMEEKINLEKTIQERTEKIVEKIIGSKDMVVLVNVEIVPKETRTTPTSPYPGALLSEEEFLPGISYMYMPIEKTTGEITEVVVKKINIIVTVDKIIKKEIIDRIKKEVQTLLGLNPLRGDTVIVEQIEFTKLPTKSFFSYLFDFLNPHGYFLLAVILITIFLYGPLSHFLRTIVKAMELKIEADIKSRGSERMEVTTLGGAPFAPGLPSGGPLELALTRKRHELPERTESTKRFSFINESNLKNLIFLLNEEPIETIAIVINYLPPELGSQVFSSFNKDTQAKIALQLANTKILDPKEVEKVENSIKTKIDYLLGGEEYFITLFETLEPDAQQALLKSIESENPILSAKLRQTLFFFEDIPLLDKSALIKVVRESQRRGISLALALKFASDEIKTKVMDVLTEGARAMLAEQMDLLGEVSEKRIHEEQKKIIYIVKELEKAGEIVIQREKKEEIKEQAIKPEEV